MTLKELVAELTRRQLDEITFTYDLQFKFSCACLSYFGIVPYDLCPSWSNTWKLTLHQSHKKRYIWFHRRF